MIVRLVFILKKQGVGVVGDPKEQFSKAAGGGVDWYSQKAAFLSNAPDENSKRIQSYYQENSSGNSYYDEEEEKEKEEQYHDALRAVINTTERIIHSVYDNHEYAGYANFTSDDKWQQYSSKALDEWSDATYSNILVMNDGTVYFSEKNEAGEPMYHRINEDGSTTLAYDKDREFTQPAQGDALTISSLGQQNALYKKTNELGQIEYVNRSGEKIDDAIVQKAKEALAKVGRTLEGSTVEYETFIKTTKLTDKNMDVEAASNHIGDAEAAAAKNLATNYTPENFINLEMKKIEKTQIGIEAKRDSGTLSIDEEFKLNTAESDLGQRREKLEKLKVELAGKTPEEANKIMAATFGSAYNVTLAQQSAEKMQSTASYTPATAPAPTNTAPQAPAQTTERTVSTAPSGLKASVDLSSAFQNAGNVPQPAPAPATAPLSPEKQKTAADLMTSFTPGAIS